MNDKDLVILGLACISACAQTGLEIQKKCLGQRLLEKLEEHGYQVTPKQPEPEEWNGSGLLPVGTEFEFSTNRINWEERVMLFNDGTTCLMAHKKHPANRWHYKCDDPDLAFRPIRTEKEKLVEKAKESVGDIWVLSHEELIDALYDEGMLKQPDSNND